MTRRIAFVLSTLVLAACSDSTLPVAPVRPAPTGAAAADRAGGAPSPIADHYIVRFRDAVSDVDGEARRIAAAHGGVVTHVYRNAIKGMSLRLPDAAAQALRNVPNVAYVEQDQVMSAIAIQTGATWGLDRTDQRDLPLGGTYAYDTDGTGVTVYIVDTGILLSHSEFQPSRAVTGVDQITPGGSAADCNGHGTHVAGTVGGTTYGVAKKVKLVAVRVLDCGGSGPNSGVLAGIDWIAADHQAGQLAAANMSLSGGFSQSLNDAVKRATADGVVFAVAAGNGDRFFGIPQDACNSSPASEPSALTVGATDRYDAQASFSNYGTCVDVNAPGVGITSAWYTATTATHTISGTSMAAPHVAGTAALYLQANPGSTPAQVTSALTSNATPGKITGTKTGTPNLLLYSGFIGAGTPAPQPPVARFTSSCSALGCTFDATTSTAATGAVYGWTYGDNTTGSGATSSHAYGGAGTYTVTLTVTDANGTSTATSTVAVAPAPSVSFSTNCSGRTCTFDASATTNASTYSWSFGNGKSGSGVTVTHSFARNSSSTITLTASGPSASSSRKQDISCGKSSCQKVGPLY